MINIDNDEYLNTHKFIYYDIPINEFRKSDSVWFKCYICNQIGANYWNRKKLCTFDKELTCDEAMIKAIIE